LAAAARRGCGFGFVGAGLGGPYRRGFGSVARGDAGPESDVDVLVEFDGRTTFDRYMDLLLALQDWLGGRVDVVQFDLHPALFRRARLILLGLSPSIEPQSGWNSKQNSGPMDWGLGRVRPRLSWPREN
jgi:hypothetical protein